MNSRKISINTGSSVAQHKKARDGSEATLLHVEKLAKRASDGWSAPLPDIAKMAKRANKEFIVGTLNVRTLKTSVSEGVKVSNKTDRIIAACEKYHIDIVAIQDHRLKTKDSYATQLLGDCTMIHTNSPHKCLGIAILYNKRFAPHVKNTFKKSDRIIAIRLKGNPEISIISAYAPTEVALDEEKDKFYEKLRDFYLSIPTHTAIILAGDLNARFGMNSNESNPRVIGSQCYYEICARPWISERYILISNTEDHICQHTRVLTSKTTSSIKS